MKTWKLVSGILSTVLFVLVAFQSCAASVAEAIDTSEDYSSGAGMLVAVMLLAGGIVSIATRNSLRNGGNIALIVLYGIGALFGLTSFGSSFSDLYIWGIWCIFCAIMAIAALVKNRQ